MRIILVILAVSALQSAFGQKLSGDDVLRNAERNFQDVKDYTVTLDIVADIERMKVPPMHATMYFKQPEKVHFDAKGFVFLPREGMGVQFGQLMRRYAVDSMARETLDGASTYRLALHPRDDKAIVRRIFMWVDASRWTPERLFFPQPDGHAIAVRFSYQRIDQYWLPVQLVVSFSAAVKDSSAPAQGNNPFAGGPAMMQRGGMRTGTVTVRYSDYRVNTGLPDSLFETEAVKRK
jgi:outer membrane lipoprotein-sorting protein